jgi:predicted DNA-binding WGR domain protein
METLLVYKTDSSNKFWKISVKGKSYTLTYGKVGSIGSVKTKEFYSVEACQKESEKLIQSKFKKGYIMVQAARQIIKESTMTEALFWELLDRCKKNGDDIDEQMEWLVSHLSKRPVKDIVMFDSIFNQNYRKSYTSSLWAAGYIVMGGCSDDCFDYFRAWVLYIGKEEYEAAIDNPETLLPYFKQLEEQEELPQLEDLLSVASMAYEEKTGLDDDEYFKLYTQLANDDYIDPEIEFDWNEEDEEGLSKKFPLLWEAYGENPL